MSERYIHEYNDRRTFGEPDKQDTTPEHVASLQRESWGYSRPGSDRAHKLDAELRSFAAEHHDGDSIFMQQFKGLVADFENNPDKREALDVYGHAFLKLKVRKLESDLKTAGKRDDEMTAHPGSEKSAELERQVKQDQQDYYTMKRIGHEILLRSGI